MPWTIAEHEDAIVTALGPLQGELGVKTIEAYEGELDAEELAKIMQKPMPAIFVLYAGSTFAKHGGRKAETLSFAIICCAKALRSALAAAHGVPGKTGCHPMLAGVMGKLQGKQLLAETNPMDLLRQRLAWSGKGLSIYVAEYQNGQSHLYPLQEG